MANIRFEHVRKVYPVSRGTRKRQKEADPRLTQEGVVAVQDFSLEVQDREFVVLVGPSGCGKSTLLRMVAGLEELTGGEIYLDGTPVSGTPPQRRSIAMVFQNYALYPHMTVFENMAFPLRMQKLPKGEIQKKVREATRILDIEELLERKPKELSGGQRQRVAIGRAIVREPKVLLMDEPLSNLDAKLRNQMRGELIKLRQKIDATFLYVTHDQTEAMTLGDRVVVMEGGTVQQVGTPEEVYEAPANTFVAGFIGTPQMNFLEGELFQGKLTVGGLSLPWEREDISEGPLVVGVRPDALRLGKGLAARIEVVERVGNAAHLHLRWEGGELVLTLSPKEAGVPWQELARGKELSVNFDLSRCHLFGRDGKRL